MAPYTYLDQTLRIYLPYIWRSRCCVWLPLFSCATFVTARLDQNKEYSLLDFPVSDEISMHWILGLIVVGWLVSLWKFPLEDIRPRRLLQTLFLYWIVILTAGLGPRLYALAQIDAINRIPEVRDGSVNTFQADLDQARFLCFYDEAKKSGIKNSGLLSKYGFLDGKLEETSFNIPKLCIQEGRTTIAKIQRSAQPYPSSEDTELLFEKIATLIEIKRFSDRFPSEFDSYRLSDPYFYLNTFLLASVLLFFTTKTGMDFLGDIPGSIGVLFKVHYRPRSFEWLEDRLIRNWPDQWAIGLHVGFALMLSGLVFLSGLSFFGLIASESEPGPSNVSVLILFCYLWIVRQFRLGCSSHFFEKNLLNLIFCILILCFFFYSAIIGEPFTVFFHIVFPAVIFPWLSVGILISGGERLKEMFFNFISLPLLYGFVFLVAVDNGDSSTSIVGGFVAALVLVALCTPFPRWSTKLRSSFIMALSPFPSIVGLGMGNLLHLGEFGSGIAMISVFLIWLPIAAVVITKLVKVDLLPKSA